MHIEHPDPALFVT